MGWTSETWRERARRSFEVAAAEGGVYLAWALKIGASHAGSEVWAWDLLPMKAVKSIFRDCSRLTQYEEPFDIEGDVLPPVIPKRRTWAFLCEGLSADKTVRPSAEVAPV